jgi:threonine dehydratase
VARKGRGGSTPLSRTCEPPANAGVSFVVVEDYDLRAAMRLIADSLVVLVEPAGAAGVAALSRHRDALSGERVAILLTGAAA